MTLREIRDDIAAHLLTLSPEASWSASLPENTRHLPDAGHDVIKGIETDDSEKTTVGGIKLLAATAMGGATVATGTVVGAPAGMVQGAVGMVLLGTASLFEHRHAVGDWLEAHLPPAEFVGTF